MGIRGILKLTNLSNEESHRISHRIQERIDLVIDELNDIRDSIPCGCNEDEN